MKKLLTTLLLSTVIFTAAAQSEQLSPIGVGSKTIGTNYDISRDIVAREYLSGRNIYSVFVDSVTNSATVLGRDSHRNGNWSHMGNLTILDLSNDHARWGMSLDNKHTQIIQVDNILIRSWDISNKSYGYDMESGNVLWESNIVFYYVDQQTKIGIGYKFANFIKNDQNTLFGVDLVTGKTLWHRELSRKSGWSGVEKVDGSTVLVASGGLHAVDINTGQGWSTPLVTGRSEYKGDVVGQMDKTVTMDFALNHKIGTPRDYTSGLASNILSAGQRVYFAGQNKVVCVDDSGSLVWEHAFTGNVNSGSSELFIRDGKLFMVNKGYGIRGATKVNYGLSFFACFDAVSGDLLFRSEMGSSLGVIDKVMASDDFLYLVSAGMVAKYSLESGARVSEKVMAAGNTFSKTFDFAREEESLFLLKNGLYEPFAAESGVVFYSPNAGVIWLGEDLSVKDEMSSETVFRQLFSYQGYRLIYGNGKGVVISNAGKIIAQIEMTDKAFIKDGALYFTDKNRLYRVEMSQVIN